MKRVLEAFKRKHVRIRTASGETLCGTLLQVHDDYVVLTDRPQGYVNQTIWDFVAVSQIESVRFVAVTYEDYQAADSAFEALRAQEVTANA